MPRYFFTARSQKGQPYSGTREAKDKHQLARILRQEGYVLISAVIEQKKKKKLSLESWQELVPLLGKVSLKEKMMFARNLQVMISAGVSLPKALQTLSEQSKNRKFKKTLLKIADGIIKGKSFSSALAEYPDIFSNLFCNVVKVGEESGALEENLGILVRQMERENDLKTKIKGAMMYPAVIIIAMIGIGILMLVMVVPKLAETFEELEVELPLTTKIVIGLGTFLTEKWYLVILLVFVLIIIVRLILRTKIGKMGLDTFNLKIPVISTLIKKTNAAYTVRTLSSLISAGTPLVRALQIVSETLNNFYFRQALTESIEKVKRGQKLSEALRPYQELYPLTVIQMIEVGEETGQTSEVLQKLADFYEEEVANATKNLASVIEPVIMLLIGGAVGFFAISMVQPIYSMMGSV
jgi:type IV pilus assembly protein PilC